MIILRSFCWCRSVKGCVTVLRWYRERATLYQQRWLAVRISDRAFSRSLSLLSVSDGWMVPCTDWIKPRVAGYARPETSHGQNFNPPTILTCYSWASRDRLSYYIHKTEVKWIYMLKLVLRELCVDHLLRRLYTGTLVIYVVNSCWSENEKAAVIVLHVKLFTHPTSSCSKHNTATVNETLDIVPCKRLDAAYTAGH